jgi:hypothetical protein
VSHDPERAWAEIAPYVLYEAQTYASFQTGGQRSTPMVDAEGVEDLKASPQYLVGTPDQVVEAAGKVLPMKALTFNPLAGGLPGLLGQPRLRVGVMRIRPTAWAVNSVDRAPVLVGVGSHAARHGSSGRTRRARAHGPGGQRAGEDCGGSGGLADGPRARASRDLAAP